MKRDLNLFLQDIIKFIKNIEEYTKNLEYKDFVKNKLTIDAVIRNLEIIGEATKNIPITFRNKYPSVDWRDIAGLRDVLTHGYFGVSLDKVWNVIKDDLPKLKKDIETILKNYKS